MTTANTDRIEKQVVLRAPRSRVWRAVTNAQEFGDWFGVRLTGELIPGQPVSGRITYPGYEHLTMTVIVEAMEPERLFSYRWHPSATDLKVDYSTEPTTLVVFELKDVENGTLLTVTESGFDALPLARRAEAYRGNERGWEEQMTRIRQYVDKAA
jgi:uncharacterized protein YndB with AHSA1/START domain